MAQRTLDRMAAGGIYDHIGGGFHRYAVDAIWLVPHFEKMLYDNAQLASAYLAALSGSGATQLPARRRGDSRFRRARVDQRRRRFLATLDADSEGHEGLFYTWTVERARGGAWDRMMRRLLASGSRLSQPAISKGGRSFRRRAQPADVADRLGISEEDAGRPLLTASSRRSSRHGKSASDPAETTR